MAERSGFFNALKTDTGYDIKYNSDDYCDNLAAIISDGVRRSADNELRVVASGGMNISVTVGRAWIKGHWYNNDSIFTDFSVPTAPTGDRSRIDRVVLRYNKNIETRAIRLVYLTGTASTAPTAPEITREDDIYDLVLADINVPANALAISQTNITDQRGNGAKKEVFIGYDESNNPMYKVVAGDNLCGWISSPIGYEHFYEYLNDEFLAWWQEKKDKLASTTLFKKYIWSTLTEEVTSNITFNIPQYDPSGVDNCIVYSNGLLQLEGIDYTLTGSVISFTEPKIAGTRVAVIVEKSIDGENLGSVSDEITELQKQLATVKNIGEYIYICNGVDDNVQLSNLAQAFYASDTSEQQKLISVYGKFGATAPVSGSGTPTSRYRWIDFGVPTNNQNSRLIIDFAGCSKITFNCSGYSYIGFYGDNYIIKNANVLANCRNTDGAIELFVCQNKPVTAEDCIFNVTAYTNSIISADGTFKNCKGSVTNSRGNSCCFSLRLYSRLKIFGGEYYAYTGLNTAIATVVYSAGQAILDIAVCTVGMSCPTLAKELHYQKNAILCSGGFGYFTNTMTALTIQVSGNNIENGTISIA